VSALPITETPEFKAAVAEAAEKAIVDLLAEARVENNTTEQPADANWMRALAMEISQLTDQGTGRRRVAPEVIRARAEGRQKMIKLIVEARAAKRVCTYRVRAKTHLCDRVVEPFWIAADHTAQPTMIDWDGIPNDAMVPENDTAKVIYSAYQEWIGTTPKVVPEEDFAITPGGLVVHGGASSLSAGRRKVGEAAQAGEPAQAEEEGGLRVHHKTSPGRFVEKRILGSIQQPARQTV
jgi:hypothetical protein